MNEIVYADEIVMIGDIAEREGVTKTAVQYWMRRPDFPKPVATIRAGSVYDYSRIRKWRRERAEKLRQRADEIEGIL